MCMIMPVIVQIRLKTQHLEQASSPAGLRAMRRPRPCGADRWRWHSMRRAPGAWSYPSGGHGFRPFLNTAKTCCPHDG